MKSATPRSSHQKKKKKLRELFAFLPQGVCKYMALRLSGNRCCSAGAKRGENGTKGSACSLCFSFN